MGGLGGVTADGMYPAWYAEFHDRSAKIHLDTDLIAHMLQDPPAPSLHTSNVRLQQTRRATSLPTMTGLARTRPVATFAGIRPVRTNPTG